MNSELSGLPTFSIIIPTKNEAEEILKTLSHIQDCSTYYPTEIIVVDGGSSDATVSLAQQKADTVLTLLQSNRSAQMHFGATHAQGEILLFLHADTLLPKDWQKVVENLLRGKTIACAFQLGFDSKKFFYNMVSFFTRIRTSVTRIPHGDQALAVKRESYFNSGGYPDTPLMEEYLFIPKLRKIGAIKLAKEQVQTSSRRYLKKGPLKNVLRNLTLILLFFLGVSPDKLAQWYY